MLQRAVPLALTLTMAFVSLSPGAASAQSTQARYPVCFNDASRDQRVRRQRPSRTIKPAPESPRPSTRRVRLHRKPLGPNGIRLFLDALIMPRVSKTYDAVLGLAPEDFDIAFREYAGQRVEPGAR